MKNKWKSAGGILILLLFTAAVGVAPGAVAVEAFDTGKPLEELEKGNAMVNVSVHDPSIVASGGSYYIFGSHMEAARSEDLKEWKSFASGVNADNPLFDNLFTGEMGAFSYVGNYESGGYAVWAPCVIYNEAMEKWTMYFSTSHDYVTSNICLATADQVEGPYTYVDNLLYSGFTSMNVDKTNFYQVLGEDAQVSDYLSSMRYNNLKFPNCIDPTVFYDEDGRLWMVYGSWSGGIWLLELDGATGYPIHPETAGEEQEEGPGYVDPYFGKYLCGGLHNSCEGPYILYDRDSGWYYLFVSFGSLTREGGYQIRQFRSENVDGPYVDAAGQTFGYTVDHSAYGVKMMGNYELPSLSMAYMAPGHNSALADEDGKKYLVYHQRMDGGSEYHEPRVHQMFANENGWLVAAPFATRGESLKEEGYDNKEAAGLYYVVNHGTDISPEIHSWQEWELHADGTIYVDGQESGSWQVTEGTSYITLQCGEKVWQGVLLEMEDEAGNAVRCFTACGESNETVWGVHYLQE